MKLTTRMSNKRTSLYLFPAAMLCLHLMLAVSGLLLSSAYQVQVDAKTAELFEARTRLRDINESELNKDYILGIMSRQIEEYRIFARLFRILAAVGAVVSCLSIVSLIQIYKRRCDVH